MLRLFEALPPRFKRDSAHQYGLMAGLVVAEFLYTALLARTLGPQNFGLLVLFVGAARICQGVTDLRVHELVIRYAETARATGSANALAATLRRALRLDLLSTFAGFLVAIGIAMIIPQWIRGASEHRPLMLLAAVSVTAGWAGRYWSIGVLRLFHQVGRQARIQLGGAFAKLIATAVWFAIFGLNTASALIIAAVTGAVAALMLVVAAMRVGRAETSTLRGEDAAIPEWHGFLASNYAIGLLETAYRELDVQLVGWLGSFEQVSVFKLAKTFAAVVLQVVDPVVLLLLPQFSRDVAAQRWDELRRFIRQIAAGFAAIGVALGLAAHFIVPFVMPLLVGNAYLAANQPFRVLIWCFVVTMPLLWAHALCIALGRPRLYLAASVVSVGVLIALSFALVPSAGAIGAAWAYGASQIVLAALAGIAALRVLR